MDRGRRGWLPPFPRRSVKLFLDTSALLAACGSAQVLLTLGRADFMGVLGAQCYGLPILRPYDFLERERAAERLPSE